MGLKGGCRTTFTGRKVFGDHCEERGKAPNRSITVCSEGQEVEEVSKCENGEKHGGNFEKEQNRNRRA